MEWMSFLAGFGVGLYVLHAFRRARRTKESKDTGGESLERIDNAPHLKYHKSTFRLLASLPVRSEEAAAILDRREEETGCPIPESIREWYELEDSESYISHQQWPYSLAELGLPADLEPGGAPEELHLGAGRYDLVRGGYIPVVRENQCCVQWHARLDGDPDPAVYVYERHDEGEYSWKLYANSFSEFIYTLVWDYQLAGVVFEGENLPTADVLEARLASLYPARVTTWNWKAEEILRYGTLGQRAVIYDGEYLCLRLSADSRKKPREDRSCGSARQSVGSRDRETSLALVRRQIAEWVEIALVSRSPAAVCSFDEDSWARAGRPRTVSAALRSGCSGWA